MSRHESPCLRSSYGKVGSIVYFGRMLDKIRLHVAGRLLDGYNTKHNAVVHQRTRSLGCFSCEYISMILRVNSGTRLEGMAPTASP